MAEPYEVELSYSAQKMRGTAGIVDSLFLLKKGDPDRHLYMEVQDELMDEDRYDEVAECVFNHGFDEVDELMFSVRDWNGRLPDKETLRGYLKAIKDDISKLDGFKVTFDTDTEKFINGGPIPGLDDKDIEEPER